MQTVLCPFCGSDCTYFSRKRQLYLCEECENAFSLPETNDESSPQRLFFSYGHDQNMPLVLKLKADLERRGHFVWIDNAQIRSGDDWRRSITDGLMNTSSVLSFLSRHSVRSPGVCLDELRIALCAKGSLIKTVLLEKEEEVLPPSTLCDTQWLDMSDWQFQKEQGPERWERWYGQKFEELCAVIESPESRNFSGEISLLKQLLSPSLSDSKEQFLLRHTFVGRQWLDDELERWRTDPGQKGAFLLIGGPGLGKSSFAAHILHYNPHAVCGVYCEWDKPSTTDAHRVIRTIAFKLATKLPDYRKLLVSYFQSPDHVNQLDRLEASELFDQLLTNPLSHLIDGGRDTSLILIDGLDEASSNQANPLAQVLSNNLCKLPSWLRLVLTSRPESEVLAMFSGYLPRIVHPDAEENMWDILAYLALKLKDRLALQPDRLKLLRHMAENCQGSFLYATLLVDNLNRSQLSLEDASSLPPGLDSFFLQNFKRKFPLPADYEGVRTVLEGIVAAQVIPVELLTALFGLTPYQYREFTEKMGSLLRTATIREGQLELEGLTFCHKSVTDWITSPQKSRIYFVDAQAGVRKLAQYCCVQCLDGSASHSTALQVYLAAHATAFLVQGKLWRELEEFLLDARTGLIPHWRVLDRFPPTWDLSPLIRHFWAERDHAGYLAKLQRRGEQAFVTFLLKRVTDLFGIGNLDIKSLQIYIDAVHLGGSYEDAAALCTEYLSAYSLRDVAADRQLLLLAIRRLHHSMFFAPVKDLIDQALVLEQALDPEEYPAEYNELLFLIGGNLGVLRGDFDFASEWNDLALSYARNHGLTDYESRAIRKKADLLIVRQEFDAALELIGNYVSADSELNTRYQVYLLGSLGEIHRHKRQFDLAYACFSRLDTVTRERGIPGWTAHALLGLANLYLDFGYWTDAEHHLEEARAIYRQIRQKWGLINTAITCARLDQARGLPLRRSELEALSAETGRLQYLYYAQTADQLRKDGSVDFFPLLFL